MTDATSNLPCRIATQTNYYGKVQTEISAVAIPKELLDEAVAAITDIVNNRKPEDWEVFDGDDVVAWMQQRAKEALVRLSPPPQVQSSPRQPIGPSDKDW